MRESRTLFTNDPSETLAFGELIGREARPGDIYALYGDLGAGKTVFTQGLARGLGIPGHVNSPTFTIMQVYDGGRYPLYHFDTYRLTSPDELDETGFEEYFYGDGITVIEWASRVEELLPGDCIRIDLTRDHERGDNARSITVRYP